MITTQTGEVLDAEVLRQGPRRVHVRTPHGVVEWLAGSGDQQLRLGNGTWVLEEDRGCRWALVPYRGDDDEPDDAACTFWALLDHEGRLLDMGDCDSHAEPGGLTCRQARDENLALYGCWIAEALAEDAAAIQRTWVPSSRFDRVLRKLGDGILPKSEFFPIVTGDLG
jgi:hypothetical protein